MAIENDWSSGIVDGITLDNQAFQEGVRNAITGWVFGQDHHANASGTKLTWTAVSDLKASGAEIDTGTEDAKIVTPKAVADSKIVKPSGAPSQGDILYHDGSAWARLAAGAAGQYLKTQGAGANPTWATVESGGDGWTAAGETWTYASPTTFTISGDKTSKYQKGDKIKLTNDGSVKYFYIIGVSYSDPNTTVTVTGGSDYSLANAAITSPYYSKIENPQGFPGWFNWTPTYTGFSSGPTGIKAKFKINGSQCIALHWSSPGTSNATDFTISCPVASVTATYAYAFALVVDNGTNGDGIVDLAASTTSFRVRRTGLAAFAASGDKNAIFEIIYEI